jgi:AcrR family transcriptional regulator
MSTDPAEDRRGRPRSTHAHAAILDATLHLLTEVGYTRLTVEGIAARAGVSKTTIYRWWPTKSALTVEAIRSGSTPAPVEPAGDLRTDVRAAVQAIVDCYARSAVGAALPGVVADVVQDGAAGEVLDALLHPHREALQRIVRDAADRGEIAHDVDTELLHEVVAGALFYRVLLGRRMSGDVAEELVGMLLDGLPVHRGVPR